MKAKLIEARVWEGVTGDQKTVRASTLEVLDRLGGGTLDVDIPGGLKQTIAAWRSIEEQVERADLQRRELFDVIVSELIREGWGRSDIAFFVGKSQTVIRRALLRHKETA